MYCVYWIKLKEHSDVSSEGYVGISKNFEERMRAHRKNKKKTPLRDAILKYSWEELDKTILATNLTLEEALLLERNLRPTEEIGWNCQRGGELGVNPEWYESLVNKEKHRSATSIATKIGIEKKDTKEARKERAKNNWIIHRDSYCGISKGEKNPKSLLTEEEVAFIKYLLFPAGLSNTEIALAFNVKHYVISFIRTGKNWKHI